MSHRSMFWRLGAAAALVVATAGGAAAVQPGDPAPDFTLVDVTGTPHTLSSLHGKVVLLGLIGFD